MNIQRYENEEELSNKFQGDLLKCYSLAPGIAKNRNSLLFSSNFSFMNSVNVKKDIEKIFGKSDCFVIGKQNKANFFAFTFSEKIIVCTCEKGDIGTAWYWADLKEEGSRYGNPMLLSWDKEVKDFWPDFCNEFKELINNKPIINSKSKIK